MAYFHLRPAIRRTKALLVVLGYGLLGVCVDLDHVICILLRLGVFDPATNEYGCRLWHPYLLAVSGGLICISGALGIGLLAASLYHAAKSAAQSAKAGSVDGMD